MIRPAAVAGHFYPDNPSKLTRQVDELVAEAGNQPKVRAKACLVPHAAYRYSGRVAGAVYGRVEIPARVIVLGPRHKPRGAPMAILTEGEWQTPLGPVSVDADLAGKVLRAGPGLRQDAEAHSAEHSIEVQLPILQRLQPALALVPIVIGAARYEPLEALGLALAKVVLEAGDPILTIASSDLNHYESDAITREKDRKAIACMLMLDPEALFDTVRKEQISMCGYAVAVAVLAALRELGATRAELVHHTTSAEVNGDVEEVVGYAGIIFS